MARNAYYRRMCGLDMFLSGHFRPVMKYVLKLGKVSKTYRGVSKIVRICTLSVPPPHTHFWSHMIPTQKNENKLCPTCVLNCLMFYFHTLNLKINVIKESVTYGEETMYSQKCLYSGFTLR